jgi:hypothetical protein
MSESSTRSTNTYVRQQYINSKNTVGQKAVHTQYNYSMSNSSAHKVNKSVCQTTENKQYNYSMSENTTEKVQLQYDRDQYIKCKTAIVIQQYTHSTTTVYQKAVHIQ